MLESVLSQKEGAKLTRKKMPLFTGISEGRLLKCSEPLKNNWFLGWGYIYSMPYSFIETYKKGSTKALDDLVFY